ncbi:GtrA family protein [Nocardioides limicola]|uniref:GtrA family protein n=1 Tax=Nocardioides limicola TaxID=2803368 RepID=UPI00193B6D09|nr:GtrA family protein [Nocardioides sp. DJM-14]
MNTGRRLVDEISRFLAVGGVATLVAVALFNFLLHGFHSGDAWLADRPLLAFIVANAIGMSISYNGSRHWAFQHRRPVHPDGGRTMYLLINSMTMVLPLGCLWFSRNVLELTDPISDNVAANVIGLTLGVTARFWLFRHLVFARPAYHKARIANTIEPIDHREGHVHPGVTTGSTETPRSDPTPPPGP